MKSQEFERLLDKYSRGQCTPEEEKFIDDWYDNIRINGSVEQSPFEIKNRLWNKVRPSETMSRKIAVWQVAAAVAFLIIAGAAIILGVQQTDQSSEQFSLIPDQFNNVEMKRYRNTKPVAHRLALSDGSTVTLEPMSEIWYPEAFAMVSREVYLTGEAFFNVRRDTLKPFLVYSKEVVTRVLGTSFTVKAYDQENEITVSVKSGKVSVTAKPDSNKTAQREVILTPNQKVVFHREDKKVSKELVEEPEVVLAEPTLFVMQYDGVPVTKLFEALEENYGIDIVYDSALLEKCVLTTSMKEEGFYERIDVICKAINAKYVIDDTTVVIEGQGCQ